LNGGCRKTWAERIEELTEKRAIVRGVCEYEQDLVDPAVSLPFTRLSNERLDIADPSHCLDAHAETAEPEERVPRAQRAWNR
jgi:hypothetical protein